ncbi:MAG: dockerin type I repeat-containing protein [Candidatus Limousia pullorum]
MSEVYVVEVTTKNPDDYELGDVNMDEEINVLDVSLIQKFLVNLVSASDKFDKSLADYNQDDKINIIDATYIQIYTSRK